MIFKSEGDIIKKLFKTVVIVTVFSFAERALGFIYRIYLSRALGAEGLGVYQIALSVLGLFMTMCASGIPITVSRTMIKNRAKNNGDKNGSVISSGIILSLFVSVPLTVLVLTDCPLLGFLFSDKRCGALLSVMIPGLIFTSVYAVIRGVFWGNSDFLTYSVIELMEEAVMMIAGIILISGAVGSIDNVSKAGLAVLISYLFSFGVAAAVFFIKGGKLGKPKKELKPLFSSSAPITAMRTGTSLINTLIAVIMPARLIYFGMSSSEAVSEFGKVIGMAMPLITMPSTLIGSLALVLVPELSSNYYSGKFITLKNNIEKAIKISCFISCMIIPVFLVCGEEIGEFIYSDGEVGTFIIKSAITMLPLCLSIITSSMLNSLNKEKRTLLNFSFGAVALLICIYILPAFIGINSLILGTFLNYLISGILNLSLLDKITVEKPAYKTYLLKSAAFILPSFSVGFFVRNILKRFIGAFPATAIAIPIVLLFQAGSFYVFGMTDFKPNKIQKNRLKGLTSAKRGTAMNNKA